MRILLLLPLLALRLGFLILLLALAALLLSVLVLLTLLVGLLLALARLLAILRVLRLLLLLLLLIVFHLELVQHVLHGVFHLVHQGRLLTLLVAFFVLLRLFGGLLWLIAAGVALIARFLAFGNRILLALFSFLVARVFALGLNVDLIRLRFLLSVVAVRVRIVYVGRVHDVGGVVAGIEIVALGLSVVDLDTEPLHVGIVQLTLLRISDLLGGAIGYWSKEVLEGHRHQRGLGIQTLRH